jgi:hypothetical protein
VLNSESIVIIRIKGKHLLYSKISGGMIGYGWGNVCYIVNVPPGEYLLYSKVSEGKVYYIANFTIWHRQIIWSHTSYFRYDVLFTSDGLFPCTIERLLFEYTTITNFIYIYIYSNVENRSYIRLFEKIR